LPGELIETQYRLALPMDDGTVVEYRRRSIVLHQGHSINSGHYFALVDG